MNTKRIKECAEWIERNNRYIAEIKYMLTRKYDNLSIKGHHEIYISKDDEMHVTLRLVLNGHICTLKKRINDLEKEIQQLSSEIGEKD